jgi:hypothetical protein
MKSITHLQKVLWGLYCQYTWIPNEEWSILKPDRRYNFAKREYEYVGEKRHWYSRRSKEQWDFIRSKYYNLTEFENCTSSVEEFISYLEPASSWNGKRSTRSAPTPSKPYNYRKYGRYCRYGRGGYCETRTKYQKKEEHKKKELSEDTVRKREWKKKVNKSKSNPEYSYKRKKDCIEKGNRAERRYVKTKLGSSYFGQHFPGWKICGTNGCYKEYEETDWDNYIDRDKRYWASSWDWD